LVSFLRKLLVADLVKLLSPGVKLKVLLISVTTDALATFLPTVVFLRIRPDTGSFFIDKLLEEAYLFPALRKF
jgi:hypothetical protein